MLRKIFNSIHSIPLMFIFLHKNILNVLLCDMELYRKVSYPNENYKGSLQNNVKLFTRLVNRHREFRNIFIYRVMQGGISPFDFRIVVFKFLYPPIKTLFLTPYPRMDISPGGLILYHPFSTIINAKKIGKNVIIRNNTTIGNTGENLDNSPIIGDNVNVGVGSIIVGKIVIGSNVIIGAGSVVVKDLPNNCVAAGNPARIIRYI